MKYDDYSISKKDAETLKGVVCLPNEYRVKLLAQEFTKKELIQLFSAFIGLSNSVVANTREFIELYLVTEYNHFPQTAEKINLPTIFGALEGIDVAIPPSNGMCHGCAFRLGTAANQSPVTAVDAKYCSEGSSGDFMCHEDLDEKGEPTHKCVGYAREVKAWK